VQNPALGAFDVTIPASYGETAQKFRLQAALDDAILHIPEDAETSALEIDATFRRNGREPETIHLTSRSR
jgi:hypothetical protein